jgi:xanthine dehydrogenase molybdopterin-binding subunit B
MQTDYYSSGSLVCVYADGTVLVSTGGSELGQGLNTKVAMCAAYTLGVPLEKVAVGPRETSKVPNNTATGGSGTSESSSEATILACQQIVTRLKPYTAAGKSWDDAVAAAIGDNVPLMACSWEHITDTVNTNHYAT